MPAPDPMGTGPALPFMFDGNGEFPLITDNELVIQGMELLFKIEPGERPMDMDFGHNYTRLLFMNWDPNVKTLAETLVTNLIAAIEDRWVIVAVNAERFEDPAEIRTEVRYQNIVSGEFGTTEIVIG